MDPSAAPLSPPWLVAVCVVLAYLALAVVWRRPHWSTIRASCSAGSGHLPRAALLLVDVRGLALRVHLDASEEPLMLRRDPAREVYAEATRSFGNDDIYVIAMLTDDVFTQANLAALRRISHAVLKLPGVRRAESLVDVPTYRWDAEKEWLDVSTFIDEVPSDPAALALRTRPRPDLPKLSSRATAAAINLSRHEIGDRALVVSASTGGPASRPGGPGREFAGVT
jgi:hypothetical protein